MSGDSRVVISENVRKMIQGIKEIAGKHSDDDIHAMLKECNMDPDAAAQRLLYIDTFHEVKRRRDRRKVNVSNRAHEEEYRWAPGMQFRGSRGGGTGNYSSPYVSDDAGGGRNVSARKENGVNNRTERGSRPSKPVLHKTENNATSRVANSSIVSVNGSTSMSNGSSSHGPAPQLSAGVYSSASDPVLLPSLNSQNPGAVETIKREIGGQHMVTESSVTLLAESRSSTGENVANTSQVPSGIVHFTNRTRPTKCQGVKISQVSEPSQLRALPTHNGSLDFVSDQNSWSLQQRNGPSKVVASETATLAVANSLSLPENDTILEEATSKLDMKLDKLNIAPHQLVIFPDHLQVPEAFKKQLTFGSLDATLGGKDTISVAKSVQVNGEAGMEPSLSNQSVSSTAQEGDCPYHLKSPLHVPENPSPLEDNVTSGSVPKYDQSKQEIMSPLGGPQNPLLQTTQDYSCVMPGPHLGQLGLPELQGGNPLVQSTSGSTPPATQPAGIGQNSIAVPSQNFPFIGQPYPLHYYPYGPYFPPFYLPHPPYFPQQPAATAAASGVNFPVPSPYKPGANAGNLAHYGFQSGYGSYGGYPVGFNPSAAVTSGSSASGEDLAASELKESNNYSIVQKGEDSHIWPPALGQDISSLQATYFYNLPQGHPAALSPAQAGSPGTLGGNYHPSETIVGSVESVAPPSGGHQQPQHVQTNWNSTLQSRENC